MVHAVNLHQLPLEVCYQDAHERIARQQQQQLTSLTQYNTASAKDLKLVYKIIKAISFQMVMGKSLTIPLTRGASTIWRIEEIMLTLEFLPTKVSKL